MIPLKADPRLFKFRKFEIPTEQSAEKSDEELVNDAEGTAEDTIVLELKVRCRRNQGKSSKTDKNEDKNAVILDEKVFTNSIKAIPKPGQPKDIGPIHDDILIAKMRPGENCKQTAVFTKNKYQKLATLSKK